MVSFHLRTCRMNMTYPRVVLENTHTIVIYQQLKLSYGVVTNYGKREGRGQVKSYPYKKGWQKKF